MLNKENLLLQIDIDTDDGDIYVDIAGKLITSYDSITLPFIDGLNALRTAKIVRVKGYKVSQIDNVTGKVTVLQEQKETDVDAGQYFLDYCKEAADLLESGESDNYGCGGNCTLSVFILQPKVKKKLLNR